MIRNLNGQDSCSGLRIDNILSPTFLCAHITTCRFQIRPFLPTTTVAQLTRAQFDMASQSTPMSLQCEDREGLSPTPGISSPGVMTIADLLDLDDDDIEFQPSTEDSENSNGAGEEDDEDEDEYVGMTT